jgi:hypothetical protein
MADYCTACQAAVCTSCRQQEYQDCLFAFSFTFCDALPCLLSRGRDCVPGSVEDFFVDEATNAVCNYFVNALVGSGCAAPCVSVANRNCFSG